MERFVRGDVVVTNFPYSDLSGSKKRPSLILADLQGDDVILCQITGKKRFDKYSIELNKGDFKAGDLSISSMIRPNRLFTADKKTFLYKKRALSNEKLSEVIQSIIKILNP